MNKIIGMRGLHFLAGSALLMFASLSHAQYVWVDEKGVKQFSDRSPPSNIPAKNILKTPRGQMPSTPSVEAAPSAAGAAASAPASLADREADYKKRQVAKADAEKKANEEAAVAAAKKANCEVARANKAQLDSGVRMRTGADGAVMDDAQRARESAAANKALADCR
ncbi:MAG TPA: DUF4124 domain-containing protein [Telluria sp.]|jgi:hypothetical protein